MIEPSVEFPRWILLAVVGLIAGLSTTLSDGHWLRLASATVAGVFAGLCSGWVIFPPSDGIANSYVPFEIVAETLASSLVALLAGLVGRRLSISNKNARLAVWLALVCCVAFGPAGLAMTPLLVAHRVARNDRMAAERFESLKNAVERTLAEAGNPERVCDGQTLRRHYSGPPFSKEDWSRITGNYVQEDGYSFMVYCREKNGYTIDAHPFVGKGYGTRRLCTDESGKIGCGLDWNRSRYACVACPR
jgi:hypothetical protein